MCCIPDIISADLAKNVSPFLPSWTLIPFKSYRYRVSASRPLRSTLISSSRVFVCSRVAPDKNICKHERQHGCLRRDAAAKRRCRVCWLPLIFSTKPQLMHSISKDTFCKSKQLRHVRQRFRSLVRHLYLCDKRCFPNDGIPRQEPSFTIPII